MLLTMYHRIKATASKPRMITKTKRLCCFSQLSCEGGSLFWSSWKPLVATGAGGTVGVSVDWAVTVVNTSTIIRINLDDCTVLIILWGVGGQKEKGKRKKERKILFFVGPFFFYRCGGSSPIEVLVWRIFKRRRSRLTSGGVWNALAGAFVAPPLFPSGFLLSLVLNWPDNLTHSPSSFPTSHNSHPSFFYSSLSLI